MALKIDTIRSLFPIIAPLVFFVLTPFFIAFHVYFPNSLNFSVSYLSIGLLYAPLAICAVLLLVFITLAMPPKAQKYFISILTALGLLFWFQGHILNWDYGVLAGEPILWQNHTTKLCIDILVWITALSCFIFGAKKIYPYIGFIAIVFLGLQSVSLAYTYVQTEDPPAFQNYTLSNKNEMNFSSQKNAVLIVLDAFQSDLFQEIIKERPKFQDVFQGFTYFRNTTAQYSKTYGAIPALLTGQWYENKQPIQDFLSQAFEESISTQLVEKGWSVQLYPLVPRIIGYSPEYASNIHPKGEQKTPDISAVAQQAGLLLDLTFFRISPQFVKPFWLNDYRGRFTQLFAVLETPSAQAQEPSASKPKYSHRIQRFADQCSQKMRVDSEKPSFKYFHFQMPHAPFDLNEQLEHEDLPAGREGFKRHAVAGLVAVQRFLTELKGHSLYDQTMVIVAGDHGGGEYEPGILENTIQCSGQGSIPALHHASGVPLLLIKPLNHSGKLKITDLPASLGDVLPTVSQELDLQADYSGFDLFSMPEDTSRQRRYIFYEFNGWEPAYLPQMKEYEVSGHAWCPSSWKATGRVLSPP